MPILAAARETDPIAHSFELIGKIVGSILGVIGGAILIVGSFEVPVLVPLAIGFAGMGIAGGGQGGGQLVRGIEKAAGGPRVSGRILTGSKNVRIQNLAAARAVLDTAACDGMYVVFHAPMPLFGIGGGPRIAEGAKTVLINDEPAARVSMLLECNTKIKEGATRVFIGGETARALDVPLASLEECLDLFLNKLGELSTAYERFLFKLYAAAGVYLAYGPDAGIAAWNADVGGQVFDGIGLVISTAIKGVADLAEERLGPGWRDIVEGGANVTMASLPMLKLPKVIRTLENLKRPPPVPPLNPKVPIKELPIKANKTPAPIEEVPIKGTSDYVSKRMAELSKEGHGPQRHEGDVTEPQLEDRAMHGKDPMTGTTTDGVTGDTHKYSGTATKVNSPGDYVRADEYLRNSDEFATEAAKGKEVIVVKGSKLEDIYGADYETRVTGKTRLGTKNNPTGTSNTDFTDGTMKGVYVRDPITGEWNLETMYPEPKK